MAKVEHRGTDRKIRWMNTSGRAHKSWWLVDETMEQQKEWEGNPDKAE